MRRHFETFSWLALAIRVTYCTDTTCTALEAQKQRSGNQKKRRIRPLPSMILSLLAYADDICLVANSEDNLQQMFNCVHSWCNRWRVLINANKSKCMHFCRGRSNRSEYTFKIGENVLETTDRYKYMEVIFHEKQDYSINSEALGKAAGGAHGSIISKIHSLKEFGFKAYEKLYSSCVMPILDYCSAVWGLKTISK